MLPISIGAIISLITGLGPTVSNIGKQIADYKIAKDNTANVKEKQLLDQQISEAHDRRDIVIAEAGNRLAVFMKGIARGALIFTPISVLIKIGFYDKVVGSFYGCAGRFAEDHLEDCKTFVTDSIDPHVWLVLAAASAFYLAYDIASISRK